MCRIRSAPAGSPGYRGVSSSPYTAPLCLDVLKAPSILAVAELRNVLDREREIDRDRDRVRDPGIQGATHGTTDQSVPWVEEDQRCVSSSSRPLTTAAASRLRAGRPSEWARARSRMRARCQRSWHSEHAVGSVAAVLIPTAGAASVANGGRKAGEVRGTKRAAGCTLVAAAAAAAAAAAVVAATATAPPPPSQSVATAAPPFLPPKQLNMLRRWFTTTTAPS